MPVSRRLRFEILRRDNHTCRYCGAAAPDVALAVDHVIPVALGGGDEPSNLVTSCADCNAGKAATGPDEALVADVEQDALRWAAAMEKAANMHRVELAEVDNVCDHFDAAWRRWQFDGGNLPRPANWRDSIRRLLESGLDASDLHRMLAVAMNSKASNSGTWRYFCGCCWREVSDRQETARRLLEDGEI